MSALPTLSRFLLVVPIVLSSAAVLPISDIPFSEASKLELHSPEAWRSAASNHVTSSYLPLVRSNMTSRSSKLLSALRRARRSDRGPDDDDPPPNDPLVSALGGDEYLTEITFGDATVQVVLDTGSSDTWLVQKGFQCVDSNGKKQGQSACAFGPTFNGTIDVIPDENFNITYGDGEFITGNMGYADVTIAGLTVEDQEVSSLAILLQ
jgi:hypothetical protein